MAKKKASSAALWIIMFLLILGLAGFGATNFGGSVRTVATVGDTEIEANDYVRAVEAQVRRFSQATGQQMTFAQARAFGLDGAALSQLIADAAIENEADVVGISIGDENVTREITESPVFRGLSGEFDRETYEFTLRQNGISVRDYEARVRDDVSADILRAAIGGGIETPGTFVDTLFNFAREERDVTWARLTGGNLETPIPEPTDSQLRAFHEENAELFTRPETRAIRYALLTPDMIAGSIQVEDAEIQALYDARIDEFVQPERRLVERLIFATEADASAAKARLDAGSASFDDLIDERGLTLDDVDLGDVSEADLGDAGAEVFALESPGVAGPLPSSLGPALFRMNAILNAQETTFEEARPELQREAAADRARRIILESMSSVEDLLAGGASIADLASRTDMEEGFIEFNEEVFEGVAAYIAFRTAASAASPGDFPEVTELGDGGIAVITVDEIFDPSLRPFDDVREAVIAAWEASETEAALTETAERIADRLRGGAEMAGLGLEIETDRNLQRTSFVEGTPPAFVDEVFDMDPNDIRTLSADGSAWLVRLDAVRAPDPNALDAQTVRLQFSRETTAALTAAVVAAYTQGVLNETGLEINQTALNAVNAQLP